MPPMDSHPTPAPPTILLTAFEPFGERAVNSSWEAVRALQGMQLEDGRRVVTLQLPVVWQTAAGLLRQAIDRHRPQLVINVGQCREGPIRLEQHAHNANGDTPDNDGAAAPAPHIIAGGPDRFTTSLELQTMHRLLESAGIPATLSASAGDYLCNFVSYHSYLYLSQVSPHTPTLFVHVPPIDSTDEPEQLASISRALQIIVAEAVRQTVAVAPAAAD